MVIGLFRIKGGMVTEDGAWVRDSYGKESEIAESEYRSKNYRPPFEDLPFGTKSVGQ